jgi:beta-glucanase (GH16 family)
VTLATTVALLLPHAPAQAEAAPVGNIGGWTQVLREDFNGSLNTTRWGAYYGQPGGNPYGWWSPRHVEKHTGQVWLRGYREGSRFVTAGMMLNTVPQRYGKYVVRARFERGAGIEHVMLLWPTSGTWPPEVDFSEGSATAGRTMATAHWSLQNLQQHLFASVDMRQWHTYGVEWTPTRLLFRLDGRVFGAMYGSAVPQVKMSMAIQTHAVSRVGPVSASQPASVNMAIDWVSVYRYG